MGGGLGGLAGLTSSLNPGDLLDRQIDSFQIDCSKAVGYLAVYR